MTDTTAAYGVSHRAGVTIDVAARRGYVVLSESTALAYFIASPADGRLRLGLNGQATWAPVSTAPSGDALYIGVLDLGDSARSLACRSDRHPVLRAPTPGRYLVLYRRNGEWRVGRRSLSRGSVHPPEGADCVGLIRVDGPGASHSRLTDEAALYF